MRQHRKKAELHSNVYRAGLLALLLLCAKGPKKARRATHFSLRRVKRKEKLLAPPTDTNAHLHP